MCFSHVASCSFHVLGIQECSLNILKVIKHHLLSFLFMYFLNFMVLFFCLFPSELCSAHLVSFYSYIKVFQSKEFPSLNYFHTVHWTFAIARVMLFHNYLFGELSPILRIPKSQTINTTPGILSLEISDALAKNTKAYCKPLYLWKLQKPSEHLSVILPNIMDKVRRQG